MKKIDPKLLIKIIIAILGIGLWLFTAQDVYRCLKRAQTINEKYVQFYRVQLNRELIRQAAESLR